MFNSPTQSDEEFSTNDLKNDCSIILKIFNVCDIKYKKYILSTSCRIYMGHLEAELQNRRSDNVV